MRQRRRAAPQLVDDREAHADVTSVSVHPPAPRVPQPIKDAALEAFVENRLELDKTVLTVATAGIGALVTYYTAVGAANLAEVILSGIALVAFLATAILVPLILRRNSDYCEQLLNDIPDDDPVLDQLDWWVLRAFFVGVTASALLGGAIAIRKYPPTDSNMAKNSGRPAPASTSPANGARRATTRPGTPDGTKSLNGLGKLGSQGGAGSSAGSGSTSGSQKPAGGTSGGGSPAPGAPKSPR